LRIRLHLIAFAGIEGGGLPASARREKNMKQPHTETTVQHTDDAQNTGNHKKPGTREAGLVDKIGGTRAGAENVEPAERSDET
jgi:hypothetical protein